MSTHSSPGLESDLARLLGPENTVGGAQQAGRRFLSDATLSRGITGHADVIALPTSPVAVAALVAYAHDHDITITPRGGGSGYAAGAVPDGGILLSTERLTGVPQVEAERWHMHTPAGVSTAAVRERAARHGLLYPPDPGSMEQSLIGGNIATNAGGPHTFKYGVTGRWVRALTVVLAPGELVTLGAPVTKDVAGLDLRGLMIGSEGTLGIIVAADLALIPAPQTRLPLLARYPDSAAGSAAVAAVLGSGVVPAALEYLDAHAAPDGHFLVIAEADGSPAGAAEGAALIRAALEPGAIEIIAPTRPEEIAALWRWREGVSLEITARRGGKLSEDIVVPVTRLAEAVERVIEIGARHDLEACSWGHAGDGNLHATFLIDRDSRAEIDRAAAAGEELFDMASELGGSISGEHGIGQVKRDAASRALAPEINALNARIKATFDPKGLFNPGKKLPGHGSPPANRA